MNVKITILIGLIAISFFGCASTDAPSSSAGDREITQVVEASMVQIEIGRTSGYFANMARFWMQTQLPAKGECASVSSESLLYLRIEAEGVVSKVYGVPSNARSECYAEAYTGIEVPAPPASPFYFKLDIR